MREGALYAERRADRELPEALAEGELCYVLAPRQMGKSSLRVRAEAALRARGIRSASLDITTLGSTGITPSQFYFGLIDELSSRLGLPDPSEFWKKQRRLSPVHRCARWFRDELLGKVEGRVVVFLDEIDAVRSLPFSVDDLFASIRSLFDARVGTPALLRLSFCMIGVAAPLDLMRDVNRTPFNVGRGIRLEDFTRDEAGAFLPGLEGLTDSPRATLDAVLEWTEGHPYMTQRICEVLARDGVDGAVPSRVHVARVVGEMFLQRGRVEDLNLSAVERSFAKDRFGKQAQPMLELYRRLLDNEHVLAMSDDPVQASLRLSGMAAERDDGATIWLRVRNPIVAGVFDHGWVEERLDLVRRKKAPRARRAR